MVRESEKSSADTGCDERCESPAAIFERIRREFRNWGIVGRNLLLEHQGVRYRVSCDEKAFMVYRVNESGSSRHHVPGWPVCLVSADMVFEECCSPTLGNDHYACGLNIENWLALIDSHCR
ncbi:MAG: hypothetical protein FJY85_19470 [Deltaproteobacteria bacterium]|nr:hypothetical protein [Deltaproteobacteria bacterium]